MRLLLVRHAEAVPLAGDGISSDFHRPLTDFGKAQAAALGEALRARNVAPAMIVTSPLVRAIQTAETLVKALTPGKEFLVTERLASGELKPRKLSKLVDEIDGTPLLIGHMPDMGRYAGWLIGAGDDGVDFDKAAVACINCRHEVAKGAGVLEWLIPPAWFLPT
ncbi:SixA phosphatase family protein [Limnoglobus roseus]|uniref:Phosphohistidine phosphatase SixA n=1 Tax=Limnoglobus roseus TaxID=2598579 RepID=A0A5C1AL47_9BACT|nr:histidine phosphatase family protein [Limnoglobus roseus]QEL19670.1 phosphohistidine phosphatase SixA [Limnoglobus roseus]